MREQKQFVLGGCFTMVAQTAEVYASNLHLTPLYELS